MNVLVISFSGRSGGNCDSISDYIAQRNEPECTIFKFSEQKIHPCGGCRYECFGKEPCPYLADPEYELLESICQSDLTYFVIPNYCDYPCANYFIFKERSQCFFREGRSAWMSSYGYGKSSSWSAIPIRKTSGRY